MLHWWPEPAAGDIVWCHFLDDFHLKAKPRPVLILKVFDDDAPQFHVSVVYGTSKRTAALHRGEFAILQTVNRTAYDAAGLSFDTKFDMRQILDLAYSTEWFSVPPGAPHGQTPKLGTLHASLVRHAGAAYNAAQKV